MLIFLEDKCLMSVTITQSPLCIYLYPCFCILCVEDKEVKCGNLFDAEQISSLLTTDHLWITDQHHIYTPHMENTAHMNPRNQ